MSKLRLYIIIMCVGLVSSPALAQLGEPRNDWAFGVNGGVTMNRVSFKPTVNQSWNIAPTAGLTVRYTSERYYKVFCSLQLEVNYANLGWRENIILADGTFSNDTDSPQTYHRDIHYLQVPLLARLALGKEHKGAMGYLVLGPQVGWMLGDNAVHSDAWTPLDRINGRNEQYDLAIKNRFDYGITGGLGCELNTSAGHFLVEGRYYFGLANIFGASKADAFSRSANGAIVGKVTYLLPAIKKKKNAH